MTISWYEKLLQIVDYIPVKSCGFQVSDYIYPYKDMFVVTEYIIGVRFFKVSSAQFYLTVSF